MTVLPRRVAAALVFVAGVASATPALAGPPTNAMRGYVDRIFALLDDPRYKAPGQAAERHRAVRALAEDALDFQESARRSLGAHWGERTPVERARFARLFADLIDHGYLARLSWDGERIEYDTETVNGKDAVVGARALSKSGGVTPVFFSLHEDADGRWRIYDLSFEGMSLVGNYRAQFNKIIRATSFDELVARLEAKTRTEAQASAGSAAPPKTSSP